MSSWNKNNPWGCIPNIDMSLNISTLQYSFSCGSCRWRVWMMLRSPQMIEEFFYCDWNSFLFVLRPLGVLVVEEAMRIWDPSKVMQLSSWYSNKHVNIPYNRRPKSNSLHKRKYIGLVDYTTLNVGICLL